MTSNLKKLTLTSLLAAGMVSAADAPEISMSGYFLGFMGGGFDKDFNHAGSGSENEIDLTTNIAFGTATTVDLYTSMDTGKGAESDPWWPYMVFDGITFTHKFSDDFTFVGADLIYGAGDFGYYIHKRAYSVITEDAVRGAGFMSNGLTLYTGSGGDDAWKTYLAYEAPTPEGISFSLHGEYTGLVGPDKIQAGAIFGFEEDMFSINATAGMYATSSSDVGFAFLAEPFADFGAMNVLASFYMQDAGDKDNAALDTGIEDMYFYIEPGFPINDILSFGVTLEYKDPVEANEEDEVFESWPTLYLAPTSDVLILFTAGVMQPLGDKDKLEAAGESADMTFGYGLELTGSF